MLIFDEVDGLGYGHGGPHSLWLRHGHGVLLTGHPYTLDWRHRQTGLIISYTNFFLDVGQQFFGATLAASAEAASGRVEIFLQTLFPW